LGGLYEFGGVHCFPRFAVMVDTIVVFVVTFIPAVILVTVL